jgi:hypothetical protein
MAAPANRCSLCALDYPTSYGGRCVKCDGGLDRIDNGAPMPEDEFNALREEHRLAVGDPPRDLQPSEKDALERDLDGFLSIYDELEAEALRRGPRWSAADIFEERQQRGATP